ncbi:hypothetical protein DICSQDRAFT_180669 [Dichomitus squalens LYAD-421 SS1]|uniref:F-box domain-containing protein n=1 Tax=Dichomitus squalens (strain LYAD-421) TaxID=732165 RepID=R7SYU6_DICSQ|nr:uncharacterized protein DICSQDRAFT_180669 [Dichomitus squalens LYAD-421 SS1]EJF61359.1 hypothetical protein DICSQDRAFT_180669 [Dichomitus squalens LYAD-421 SS1]
MPHIHAVLINIHSHISRLHQACFGARGGVLPEHARYRVTSWRDRSLSSVFNSCDLRPTSKLIRMRVTLLRSYSLAGRKSRTMSSVNPEAQAMQTSDKVELLDSRTADPPVAHRCLINDMLPTELLDIIFGILNDAGWSLSACTLVCKLWRHLSCRRFFSAVMVRGESERFAHFCATHPQLASCIQELRCHRFSVTTQRSLSDFIALTSILPSLTNLQTLCITGSHHREPWPLANARQPPVQLKKLVLHRCSGISSIFPFLLTAFDVHCMELIDLQDPKPILLVGLHRQTFELAQLIINDNVRSSVWYGLLERVLNPGTLTAPAVGCGTTDDLRELCTFLSSAVAPNLQNISQTFAGFGSALARCCVLEYLSIGVKDNGSVRASRTTFFAPVLAPISAQRSPPPLRAICIRLWTRIPVKYLALDDPLSPARSLDFDSLDELLSAPAGIFARLESITLEIVTDNWGLGVQPEVTLHKGLLRRIRDAGLLKSVHSPRADWYSGNGPPVQDRLGRVPALQKGRRDSAEKRRDGTPLYTLPVIHDPSTGASVSDSAAIVRYLHKTVTHPDIPMLIPPHLDGLNAALEGAFWSVLEPGYGYTICAAMYAALLERRQSFFRQRWDKIS